MNKTLRPVKTDLRTDFIIATFHAQQLFYFQVRFIEFGVITIFILS